MNQKTMSKLPQYGIFENPMDGRVFVLQTRPFFCIAQAFHFDEDHEAEYRKMQQKFDTGATVDYPGELIFLGVVAIIEPAGEGQELADRLAKAMSRMVDWYHAYLKWEDDGAGRE